MKSISTDFRCAAKTTIKARPFKRDSKLKRMRRKPFRFGAAFLLNAVGLRRAPRPIGM
ncbi:hypothetical protein CLOSTASPAR_06336 [[Clostridium] asparagiforme DSM 15981]|uniref:Uncharacterized protein n=1 Tax=[Clostridium] asparagiforme DSM 15981 TaxID=518636 RepID=C0DAN3_9FIRM|nr:hypothetical protein CLOSTASPAR_06336 [[Clostridium] asparagiforme DSM 15981]